MPLLLHNTLTRAKEAFVPLDPAHVRMYVCGPTVYDVAHIGNARPVVVFDVLYRLLKRLYPDARVTYIRNITDIDDKIIDASRRTGEPIDEITRRTAKAYQDDMAALGALVPDLEPRATAHVAEMITMIQTLIEAGHAYESDGEVLFHVPSMPDYGRLSRHSRDQLIEGARVEVAANKRDPADFVLWKPSAADVPGWDSPWGRGRPGWHIECSAMSGKYLGQTFDIHGGGQDLIFPHHENEIAQSRCANRTELMAKYWVHNGYLTVNGEKMSKSLGNYFTVHDLLKGHRDESIRLALLSSHYRHPLDFTTDGLAQARAQLDRLYGALRPVAGVAAVEADAVPFDVLAALEDDLNTPMAISHLHELAHQLNKSSDPTDQARLKGHLLAGGAVLGLVQADPEDWFKGRITGAGKLVASSVVLSAEGVVSPPKDDWIEEQIQLRDAARKAKKFEEADLVRAELMACGVVLEDGPGGTSWRRTG